jgi:hypothetical protein
MTFCFMSMHLLAFDGISYPALGGVLALHWLAAHHFQIALGGVRA